MAARQLSNLDVDGTLLGQSASDKIGFYGLATCVIQQGITQTSATLTGANVTAAVIATGAAGVYGYGQTQADTIVAQVNKLITDMADVQAALKAVGLFAAG